MKKYKNKDYLENLLKDPDELKKQILFSYGGVLYEMFTKNIIPPLSLLSSKEHQTGIGTVMVQLFSTNYKDSDVKKFVKKVVSDQKETETKREFGSHFLNSMRPNFQQYLPKQNKLKKTLKIETVEDYFKALSVYENFQNNEEKDIVEEKLKQLNVEDILLFKDIGDEKNLNLLEKNVPFLENLYTKNHYNYESIRATHVIYAILKANDFYNIPENVMPLIPLSLLFSKMEKSEDNISFMRDVIDSKILKKPELLLVGLMQDDIHYFEMFNLDYNQENDKKVIMKVIDFHNNNTYSHKAFRKFVLNSPIAKLVPIKDLTSVYYKANKLGVEFGKNIFGEESIDTLIQMTLLKNGKCLTIDNLIDFLNEGRGYSNDYLKNIQIPEVFLEQLDKKLKDAECSFIHSNLEYYRDNSIYQDKVNAYTQCLSYFTKKQIEKIKVTGTSESDLDNNAIILNFLTTTFTSLTGKDGYFDKHNTGDDDKIKMIEAVKLENLIYDYSKEVFKKSQNIFNYESIEQFKKMYKDTTKELAYGLVSSMVQNIKKPSMLWAIDSIDNNNSYNRAYSHYNIKLFKELGLSYEEIIKSYMECPSVDTQSVINELLSLDDYYGLRSTILHGVSFSSGHIYIGLINQIIDKERFPEMNDVDFYQHLNAVKDYLNKRQSNYGDYYSVFINKINESQELLSIGNIDKESLPVDYIFNLNYLHENFSIDLLYRYISEEDEPFSKWYNLKGKDISKDIVNSIIYEVFSKFHENNNKVLKIIESSKDFIFNFVQANPQDYDDIKDKLLTGPHASLYDGMFAKTDRDIVKEMIETQDINELNKLYELLTLDDLSANMEKILESKNLEMITVLKENLPGDNFVKIFNQCEYKYQRLLLDNPILANTFTDSFNKKAISFNPSNFEEFIEVFENLRLKKRVELIGAKIYSSDSELEYYDMKRKWEFSSVLKYIKLPNLDNVINYLIEEVPLSFTNAYELSADRIYGRLPRTLDSEEFMKLLKNIKNESPGTMYLGHQVNDDNKLYECLFYGHHSNKKGTDKINKINANLDNYLKILDCLKSDPKEYAQMFALTQNIIQDFVCSLLGKQDNVYFWEEIPDDCLLLKELQNVFQSKYQWPDKLNEREHSLIYREEYVHKFFNLFIDKKVYLEGFKELKEENLLNTGISEKIYKNFYSRFLYPYYYEVKLSGYSSDYTTDYTPDELNKVCKDLVEVDSALLLDYNFPKTRHIKFEEGQKLEKAQSEFTKEERKEINDTVLIRVIDEEINSENIWSVLLSLRYNVHMNSMEDDEKEKVLKEILGKPDLDLEMINILSKALDLHEKISEDKRDVLYTMDNEMLCDLSYGVFSYTDSSERKKIKITLEQLYMEQQSSPKIIEPIKKSKKF